MNLPNPWETEVWWGRRGVGVVGTTSRQVTPQHLTPGKLKSVWGGEGVFGYHVRTSKSPTPSPSDNVQMERWAHVIIQYSTSYETVLKNVVTFSLFHYSWKEPRLTKGSFPTKAGIQLIVAFFSPNLVSRTHGEHLWTRCAHLPNGCRYPPETLQRVPETPTDHRNEREKLQKFTREI